MTKETTTPKTKPANKATTKASNEVIAKNFKNMLNKT